MLVQFALFFYLVRSFWPKSNRFERLMLVIGLVTPVLTIIGASSRGSQLALAGLLLLFYGKHLYKPKVMIGMLVLCIALLYLLPDEQKERFSDMGGDDTSQQRILYWENGMEMIKEHPFTGIGLFNFIPYFTDFYPNDINFTNRRGEKVAELPHNILVQIGTDSGVPALMTYLLIVFNCIRYTKLRNNFAKNTERGLAMGVVGFFIAGQFVTVGYYPFLWITAALTTALRRVFREKV
jgi:O-antigen ligase